MPRRWCDRGVPRQRSVGATASVKCDDDLSGLDLSALDVGERLGGSGRTGTSCPGTEAQMAGIVERGEAAELRTAGLHDEERVTPPSSLGGPAGPCGSGTTARIRRALGAAELLGESGVRRTRRVVLIASAAGLEDRSVISSGSRRRVKVQHDVVIREDPRGSPASCDVDHDVGASKVAFRDEPRSRRITPRERTLRTPRCMASY